MIPLFRPSITQEEIDAVIEVIKSGWWGLGPKTREFEEAFATFIGSKHAIGLNSGTAALHLALYLLSLKHGDEVLVPTITFVSTAHAVEYVGATPVFVDVCPDTCGMDPKDAEKKITKKTKVILPVHYGGHPVELSALQKLAKKNKLTIVEDAAHACGAKYQGQRIGSISPLTCFSFHAVKNLACGEGGAITTNNDQWENKLRELRWLGISKDTWKRTSEEKVYAWQYWIHETGFKAHMHDISASLGVVQLKRIERLNNKRRELVNKYNDAFNDLDWIETPKERDCCESSWHIYYIKTPRRDELLTHLKKHNIAPGVHYFPIHMHPQYAHNNKNHYCPVAERIWPRLLSLPLFPDMTDSQQEAVIKAVRSFDKIAREHSKNLRGKYVQLRRIDFTDIEMIRKWRNIPKIRKWFFDSREISSEAQLTWFDKYLKKNDDETFIIETFDKEPIGMIALYNIDNKNEQAELGRVIVGNEKYTGKGFANDAVRVLLNYGFRDMGMQRIYAEIRHDNRKSIKLFTNSGFVEEGRKRQAIKTDNKRYDIIIMSVVKEDTL